MRDRILTRHPDPRKQGVRIDMQKYTLIKDAITAQLQQGETGFSDLIREVEAHLKKRFEGSIPWYVTTVKLDLEARGLVERIPGPGPQRLRLSSTEGER